ncbi:The BTB (BR-C, ttk and bab)/POZ (Pox virus and Zinc finger) domain [Ceratobasidium sp. AG-Ba]|nr:The BTB (BR-C, ttk and bab)/POZ (Pox virus and Zinc finger) domain [Ceratobasidium sp. AG-Ba]
MSGLSLDDISGVIDHNDFGSSSKGDLILRSVDNVDFWVHTVLIALASPTFADMLPLGKQEPHVNVGETSELLELMLSFIYPRPAPRITSFETLEKAIHMADEYQLVGMKSYLRKELTVHGSPVSAFSEPFAALAVASAHGFIEEAALASSLVSQQFDIRRVDDWMKLASAIPSSAHVLKLVGLPSARMAILVDVLFRYNQSPMLFESSDDYYRKCTDCTSKPSGAGHSTPAEWQTCWAFWAFQELSNRSISECKSVFTRDFLRNAIYKGPNPIPKAACGCQDMLFAPNSYFDSWAKLVHNTLVDRLKNLDKFGSIV